MNNKTSKYFAPEEFQRCTPSCSINDMQQDFLDLLDDIREYLGHPLLLSSAYRSKAYDLSKGRSGNSAHTRGRAVDIVCNSSATRYKIVRAALLYGVCRIGIGKNFVHIDNDETLPQGVIFHYY